MLAGMMLPAAAFSQRVKPVPDSGYIRSYDTMITARVYLSQKYLSLHMKDKDSRQVLKYYPNSALNAGVGASYGWLTINVSAGLLFLNNGSDELAKGKTKAYDLQAHFYGPKAVIDLFAQKYEGYHLYPQGHAMASGTGWYIRPDMQMVQLGFSGYYAFNWRRYSSRAAYLQNEWQVRSAGSFLLGAEVFFEQANADSSFVPQALEKGYRSGNTSRIQYGDLAPGAGYAYTLVLGKHIFISASLTGSLSLDILKESSPGYSHTSFAFDPNYAFKTGLGFNSRRFTASITWVNNSVTASGPNTAYTTYAGNARVHAAYRFAAGKKFRQKMSWLQRPLL